MSDCSGQNGTSTHPGSGDAILRCYIKARLCCTEVKRSVYVVCVYVCSMCICVYMYILCICVFVYIYICIVYVCLCMCVSFKSGYTVELAKGDSLAAFHWNTGRTWTSRPWDQDLPSDSQVSKLFHNCGSSSPSIYRLLCICYAAIWMHISRRIHGIPMVGCSPASTS